MSTNPGIFEAFNTPAPQGTASNPPVRNSPFAIVEEAPPQTSASPFAIAPQEQAKPSPFSIAQDQPQGGLSSLPDRRKSQPSPFQIAETQSYGFEAQQTANPSPFEPAPAPSRPVSQSQNPSPFSTPASYAAPQPPANWPPAAAFQQQPAQTQPTPPPAQQYANPVPPPSDSRSIKQLELRAIFGVDREMSKAEIIQRARSLPGIRQIALVNETDASVFEGLNRAISNLGFGDGPIKLYAGSVPIEFIREGRALLAVQSDGGFAPGVREALMLVARELGL
jgi:hypothetical protein